MAKVILILSILLIGAAAYLGFMTKEKVEQKVSELKQTKQTLETTKGNLATTKKDLATRDTELAAANMTIEQEKAKSTGLEMMLTMAAADLKAAKEATEEKITKIAVLEKEIEDLKKPPENPTEAAKNPAMVALQEQLTKANAELAESKVMQKGMADRQKAAEENLAVAQREIERYKKPIQAAGLTGNVVDVNSGWNFVVIDLGDKQGVSVNSALIVTRGGQRIATLKITSVEPRTSIADVVPGSLARGVFIQRGDRVVFAGGRGQPPSPGTGAPSPEAPAPPATATAGGPP